MILTGKEAAAMIDISAVRTHHGYSDIEEAVALAKKYRFINVHVLPCWVKETAEMLKGVDGVYVGSPVGFPAGAATTLTKIAEAEQLLRDGVEEMDIVMNIGKFKSGERQYVLNELREIIGMTDKKDEVLRACDLVMESGADFVKTGTGWIPGTLDLAQVQQIKEHCGNVIKLKVAGGVRTREDFIALAEMGVERVGINVASAIEIVDALNRMPYESKTLLIS